LLDPRSALFPYTTLFRSKHWSGQSFGWDPVPMASPGGCAGAGWEGIRLRGGSTASISEPVAERRGLAAAVGGVDPSHRCGRCRGDRKSTRLNSSHVEISY